jgi:hypothetical protein
MRARDYGFAKNAKQRTSLQIARYAKSAGWERQTNFLLLANKFLTMVASRFPDAAAT